MTSKLVAIIAGVGPGTGAALARKFAAQYPVALLARKPDSYNDLVKEINESGGKALGISADVTDGKSMESAIATIKKEYGDDVSAAAAVFNASGSFMRKPFLELTEDEFMSGQNVATLGAFNFSQKTLALLLKGAGSGPHPPTLIFTGATASVKASARVGAFAGPKHSLRALSSALAKEFGPEGVHVSHVIIDGIIDIPRTKEYMPDAGPDAKISPQSIADAYWNLHVQPRNAWTWEIDIRPWVEKW